MDEAESGEASPEVTRLPLVSCGVYHSLLSYLGKLMTNQAHLLPGTLDLLILKAVSLGPLHGYGVLLRIEQISGGAFLIEQGALYPALHRLVHRAFLSESWGVSEHNRKAKFYQLTVAGRKQLKSAAISWRRVVAAMTATLDVQVEKQ